MAGSRTLPFASRWHLQVATQFFAALTARASIQTSFTPPPFAWVLFLMRFEGLDLSRSQKLRLRETTPFAAALALASGARQQHLYRFPCGGWSMTPSDRSRICSETGVGFGDAAPAHCARAIDGKLDSPILSSANLLPDTSLL